MAADAFDRDDRLVARRHERPFAKQQHAGFLARMVVHAEHGVARKALEQAVGDHFLRAAVDAAFLGRLEIQMHRAREIARGREMLRGAEQHGRVAVVAARVHLAVRAARVRQAGLLDDRQRVHVGANADAALAVAHFQRAYDAGLTDPARDLPAPLFELLCDQCGGLHFLVRQFRMMMNVMANLAQTLCGGFQVGHFGQADGVVHRGCSVKACR